MQVKIGILNIMHDKVDTQKRFRHVLADADLTFFYPKTHYQKRQLPAAFAKIAEPLDLVKVGTMDAFIITGAPIEQSPFDQVDYWDAYINKGERGMKKPWESEEADFMNIPEGTGEAEDW